jgi:hypothetical protein
MSTRRKIKPKIADVLSFKVVHFVVVVVISGSWLQARMDIISIHSPFTPQPSQTSKTSLCYQILQYTHQQA